MRQNFKIFLSIPMLLCFMAVSGQEFSEVQRNSNGTIGFARLVPVANYKISDGLNFLKSTLKSGPEDSWAETSKTNDQLGMSHIKYQQFYKGVKVENAEYMLHEKSGSIEVMNGDYQIVKLKTVKPRLTAEDGLKAAMKYMKADRYMWQEVSMEKLIKEQSKDPSATYYPKAELVISRDFLKGGRTFLLAWKYRIFSSLPADALEVFIDAGTGEVIRTGSLICKTNAAATAQTIFSGTVGITSDLFAAGSYRLQEVRNGVTISTQNLNNLDWWQTANATDFVNSSTNFTSAGWGTYAANRSALDAHWAFEKVFDYWQTVHGRFSIDNNGLPIRGYTHMNSPSLGPDNAAWVTGAHYMVFGDGTNPNKPYVALDIVGHEMGHGITEFTANFAYVAGQESAALHEGFSDIWGACLENWVAPGSSTKNPWLLGQEVVTAPVTCLRNMQNPKDLNANLFGPDTYGGQFWDAANPAHMNALVLDRWFYLLSQGGSGTNDLGNAYNVPGVTIAKARLIAYRAEALYLTSSANYSAVRNATIQAARDLYGISSCEVAAVIKAWFAVGVGGNYPSISTLFITGTGVVCGTSQTYTLNSTSGTVPADAITWELRAPVVGSGYTLPFQNICTITPNGNQVTLNKIANGNVVLVARVANCPNPAVASKEITFGVSGIANNGAFAPNNPNQWYTTLTSTVHFTPGTTTAISMANPGNNTYTFTRQSAGSSSNSSLIYWANGNVGVVFTPPVNSSSKINLSVQTSNICGTAGNPLVFYYTGPPIYRMTVSPNPVRDVLTLKLSDESLNDMQRNMERINSIEIVDKAGVVVLKKVNVGIEKNIRIDLSQLIPDVYTVVVRYNKGGEQHKISLIE